MRFKVTHTTKYAYSEPVPVCHNEVRLTPRNDRRQHCESHRLLVTPEPADMITRVDYFGNELSFFSILETHRGLSISAVTQLDVLGGAEPEASRSTAWETVRDALRADVTAAGLANFQYAFNSPRVKAAEALAAYAADSFAKRRPIVEAVLDLTDRIHHDFTFAPRMTNVDTPLEEVFAMRCGVCQDFAHVQIGCLRSLGLAARYVSGYLRTLPPPGKPRLVGADASHAWVSVFCGDAGWLDVDPTNNMRPNVEHVTLAWGRDYDDVCPVRGVLVGGGQHTMNVSVDVEPLDE